MKFRISFGNPARPDSIDQDTKPIGRARRFIDTFDQDLSHWTRYQSFRSA